MANTINDLYLKYVNEVGSSLENDRYFQYLFEMVQSGANTLNQSNQVLHKVVDERWLSTIEESLDAINNIIEKPRRFVTTKEEVVPVALAKKISAESVRHLSMNTQFIASDKDGDIQPTRILNVSTEESYDLYENRFIYHLIQRLVTFIDKRTDVIFWSTGDEKSSKLLMESKVDDAYEEINYKIEMTIKNRQSFVENDSDNMQVFMRIDRVRRLVMGLRNSAFCSLMAGCAKVRSPIQRTNLIMKDPDYRTCYKLWQFLESYDEVGYTIEEQDTALEFDEEYLIQLYTNLITNYTVFKSLLDSDAREADPNALVERKTIKPKFIKKIIEQEVDDYNLPDVEIRQVFVEEVTERQLELEKELAEETARREAEENAREDAEIRAQKAEWDLQAALQAHALAEEEAREELEKAKSDAASLLEETRQKASKELSDTKKQAEQELAEAKEKAAQELAEAREKAAQVLAEAKAEAERELAETREKAARELSRTKEKAEREFTEMKTRAEQELARTKSAAEQELARTKSAAEQELARTKSAAEQELARTKSEAEKRLSTTRTKAEQALAAVRERADKEESRRRYLEEKEAARLKALEEARIAREKAEAEERRRLEELERRRQERLAAMVDNPEERLSNVTGMLSKRNRNGAPSRRTQKKPLQKY